jgi:anti-sigma B factor antagonist
MIPGMKTRRVEPDIAVVELIGTLSLGSTLTWIETDLRRMIREGGRKLVIDVTQLRYTDSAGIGMFVTINGEIEQAGGQLRIAGASGNVAKSFSATHIDRVIVMDASVEAACEGIASA